LSNLFQHQSQCDFKNLILLASIEKINAPKKRQEIFEKKGIWLTIFQMYFNDLNRIVFMQEKIKM
jgi:hypothetical protein